MAIWFWHFILYSFLGWITECLFARANGGDSRRRCSLLLPLCPVYGLAMSVLLALPPAFLQGWLLPAAGAVVATITEYLYHWVFERLFCVRFWSYEGLRGNLRGRLCLSFSLAWGMLSAAAVALV